MRISSRSRLSVSLARSSSDRDRPIGFRLLLQLPVNLLPTDLHERRQMRQRNGLTAILVRGDLRDNLRGNVAGRGKAVRPLNQRSGNNRSVLQHILQIHQIAVMHVLRIVVRVVEVNYSFVVRVDYVLGQQYAVGKVAGSLRRRCSRAEWS